MKSLIPFTATIALLALALASWTAFSTPNSPNAHDVETNAVVAALDRRVEELEDNRSRLAKQVGTLESRVRELEERAANAIEVAGDATVVAAAAELDEAAADVVDESPDDSADPIDLDEALDLLTSRELSESERQATWDAIREEGLVDDAIAALEKRAEENPGDANAQVDVGHAVIQKLLSVSDIEKWQWAQKADSYFDRALEVDSQHWDARFSKAVSYSFWPPVFGYQAKAIEHFEVLRAQQEVAPQQQKFEQTYALLGNLYNNQGKSEKARETWTRGLELFPDSAELQGKLSARQ